ncbi:MAG: cell division protein FtsZ [Cyclonatronaceae bacterium]
MSNSLSSRFSFDEKSQDNAKLKVIGVGGGGGNAINNMITKGLDNVEYIALNTDAQALKENKADIIIQVGKGLTSGLGAGARPEVGREAVEENRHEIEESIEGADMIFVTAGMGGGTGTGGAPVVAGIAKRKNILTVGVVTTPFVCEGKVRLKYALEGIRELKKNCDTVIVIPNERLLDLSDDNTTLMAAFELANEVLYNATRGISDLILMPGLINLDFADVRTTMLDGGAAIMGSATDSGADRAEKAAHEAINSPLLDGVSIRGARNVLVNISAGDNLGMRETHVATSIIQQEAGEDAEIILGTVVDKSFTDEMRVTVIATGFDFEDDRKNTKLAPGQPVKSSSGEAAGEQPSAAELKLPRSKQVRRRFNGTGGGVGTNGDSSFWKGERNLKHLDAPAISRRRAADDSAGEADEEPREQSREQRNNEILQHGQSGYRRTAEAGRRPRKERIDKRDKEQPAFLRKLMD